MITSFIPEQVPFGFQMCPLPEEIASWLTLLLQNQPCKEQWSKQQTKSKLSHGLDSKSISTQSASLTMITWTTSTNIKNTKYSVHFATPSEKVDFCLRQKSTKAGSVISTLDHVAQTLTDQTQEWMLM
jgi:hypothetical protein